MAQLFNCGYMRVLILENFDKVHSSNKKERYNEFNKQFNGVKIEEKHFHRKCEELRKFCRKKNWFGNEKRLYLESFSLDNWNTLHEDHKKLHSLNFCQACSPNKLQDLFPSTGKKVKGKKNAIDHYRSKKFKLRYL